MRAQSLQRFTWYALIVAVLMIPVAYWTIAQGGPYARAQRFLSGHPAIERQVGRVQSVRLAFSPANSAILGTDDGTAHLELVVTGERGLGYATMELHWERGAWDVTSVSFRRKGETMPVQTFPAPRRRPLGETVA